VLAAAVEAKVEDILSQHNSDGGKARFFRNGYLPERSIQSGIGEIPVEVPSVRDRQPTDNSLKFVSALLPKYLRRTKSMNNFLPLLYLKGISTNDFAETLVPIFCSDAKNLSPGVINRLKAKWEDEYEVWRATLPANTGPSSC
jgi:transposase-like protein